MKSLTAILLAVAATVSSASASLEQTPGSSINITACSIRLPDATVSKQGMDANGHMTTSYTTTLGKEPGLTIGYTNEGKATAAEVDFSYVGHAGVVQSVTDIGTFAPGKAILHHFPLAKSVSIFDMHGRCVVTRVKYVNGNSWSKPGPTRAAEHATSTSATIPGPRTPTRTDVAQLTALIARPRATLSSIAIVGNYAEACWYSGPIGGAIIATNTSGSWVKISGGAGGYTAFDIVNAVPSIPLSIAQKLAKQASLNQI